jgi:hypothetical protein
MAPPGSPYRNRAAPATAPALCQRARPAAAAAPPPPGIFTDGEPASLVRNASALAALCAAMARIAAA